MYTYPPKLYIYINGGSEGGLFVCARVYNGCRRGRGAIVVYYTGAGGATVIGVKRERKKEICRGKGWPARGERAAKANEPRCAREGLKWSAALPYIYMANIYESLYYIETGLMQKGWGEKGKREGEQLSLQCNTLLFSRRSNHRRRGFSPPSTNPYISHNTPSATTPRAYIDISI